MMKILVDQNISFRLLPRIKTAFPDTTHVKDLKLTDADDFKIFQFARENGFDAILTLDEDFNNIQLEHGVPPKIIWLRVGNCSTAALAGVILQNAEPIQDCLADNQHDCLEILG
jgi:predicted nuclease of predicted toxin-antitoxin system